MIRVLRHTPAFIDRDPEPGDDVQVENADEMLALPYIRHWSEEPWFSHWERSDTYGKDRNLLMAITKDHKHWVVAYVDGDISGIQVWPGARR